MLAVVWIAFVGFVQTVNVLAHNTRYERTRYVSSRNQIYGGDFDANEKYIPFVHYWERPLQILESSMKIPKKLSSRPLFSWDLPVQISPYAASKRTATTEDPLRMVTESPSALQQRETHTDTKTIVQKNVERSRSDRARASVVYQDALIPVKQKKSGNRKKSIQEMENWKELETQKKRVIKSEGRHKKKKKEKKHRKEKSKKHYKQRKAIQDERINEMNDQVNEVFPTLGEVLTKAVVLKGKNVRQPEIPCEMEKNCEHRCERVNGEAMCVCYRGFTLEGDRCRDVNECETNNGGCNGKCVNTVGSRKCVCSKGFRLVDGVCADVNECLLRNGHGPCQDQCTNTLGGYYCGCDGLPGTSLSADNHTCENTRNCNPTAAGCSHSCIGVSGATFCTCPEGMELGADWKTCHDIDECLNPEDYDVRCEFGCVNTIGSYTCATQNSKSGD